MQLPIRIENHVDLFIVHVVIILFVINDDANYGQVVSCLALIITKLPSSIALLRKK